jgi:hypothetical protein
MIDLLNPYRWLLLLALCGALGIGYVSWAHHQQDIGEARATARYEAALVKQKAEAAALLSTETAKVEAKESELLQLHFEGELRDQVNEKTIVVLADKLHRLGRLRDPYAAGCGGGGSTTQSTDPASAGSGAGDASDGAGLLSERASDFLRQQTEVADRINNAYASCREDSLSLRMTLPK